LATLSIASRHLITGVRNR